MPGSHPRPTCARLALRIPGSPARVLLARARGEAPEEPPARPGLAPPRAAGTLSGSGTCSPARGVSRGGGAVAPDPRPIGRRPGCDASGGGLRGARGAMASVSAGAGSPFSLRPCPCGARRLPGLRPRRVTAARDGRQPRSRLPESSASSSSRFPFPSRCRAGVDVSVSRPPSGPVPRSAAGSVATLDLAPPPGNGNWSLLRCLPARPRPLLAPRSFFFFNLKTRCRWAGVAAVATPAFACQYFPFLSGFSCVPGLLVWSGAARPLAGEDGESARRGSPQGRKFRQWKSSGSAARPTLAKIPSPSR